MSKALLRKLENHLEILLVAGILSPNTSKRKTPTVMDQPRMKQTDESVSRYWAKLSGPSDRHLWYVDKSTNIDFRIITFDMTTITIPVNTNALFIIRL